MKWQEGRYGMHLLKVGIFEASIIWDSIVSKNAPKEQHGLKVTFEGRTLVKRFKSLAEAKQAAERLAFKTLTDALAELKTGRLDTETASE